MQYKLSDDTVFINNPLMQMLLTYALHGVS
jgi:hypothetical protein